ncbi:MAG: pyruvate, water dikinase regulatory protein [Succiniclasticum sp.]|nr:pyruvate, water dikinase regulatory protein [Succiniclasticum sp.]MDY6289889.1 pyruvate, water dikinase regulatory protein [Succiniclasticum sp.]
MYALSDSIGGTAESVIKATVSQFTETNFEVVRVPYINNKEQIDEALEDAARHHAVVCYTIVNPRLREHLADRAVELQIQVVDVLGPMLRAIQKNSGLLPKNQAGLIHALDHEYFKRVEAVEFAVKYDDGKNPMGLLKADIVIIGVSRTSKTPLSMYLAHKQLKVANVPLVPEIVPPAELFKVPHHKIIGLLIDPYKLTDIRTTRLKTMGLSEKATYADVDRITEELEYAKGIMRRVHCMIINVSNRAIEETAGIILDYYYKNTASRR